MTMKTAPVATKKQKKLEHLGDVRVDDYFWLREKENPEVRAYVEAENKFTQEILADVKAVENAVFEELKAWLPENEASVPYPSGAYEYFTKTVEGKQYKVYCRRPRGAGNDQEETLIDLNVEQSGSSFFEMSTFAPSPCHGLLAFTTDRDGSEQYKLSIRDLTTKVDRSDYIENVADVEWGATRDVLFYIKQNDNNHPFQLYRHVVGTHPSQDELLYEEKDTKFFLHMSRSASGRFIFLHSEAKTTAEIFYVDLTKNSRDLRMLIPRQHGIEVMVEHHGDNFLILSNEKAENFQLFSCPVDFPNQGNWKLLIPHNPQVYLTDIHVFAKHIVLSQRFMGLPQIRIIQTSDYSEHTISFDDASYFCGVGVNEEYFSDQLRLSFESPKTPRTIYDYDMNLRRFKMLKQQQLGKVYNADDYVVERQWAVSHDGVKVPMTIFYKKGLNLDGSNPCFLTGYGSYGYSNEARFSTTMLPFVDRGFVVVKGHIRGGSEMGRQWYENGKFLKKKNTFHDFIACAEALVQLKYTNSSKISILGGSAGGMLIGAVVNMRPELFQAAIAEVPFVDVINTMLDTSLYLTTTEYDEWGNPNDKTYYDYMKSYSPYDNVKAQKYPHLFVAAGWNDPRVTYWEPAKFVAKLRTLKTDQNLLLMRTEMGAGHQGASGRYDSLKEWARIFTFIQKAFGLKKT